MTIDSGMPLSADTAMAAWFNGLASHYDRAALRFYPFAADQLIARMRPAAGSKFLDVASGTGAVALAAAQAVGPHGRVVAVDIAAAMLDRLAAKLAQFGIGNVDLHEMDGTQLEFRRGYFDYIGCGFGLHLMPDPGRALSAWRRVTRPGATVAFTSFGAQAFQPWLGLWEARCRDEGVTVMPTDSPHSPYRLAAPEPVLQLMGEAGLIEASVTVETLGCHLRDPEEWWEVLAYGGIDSASLLLDAGRREALRVPHLAEVGAHASASGLALAVEVNCFIGRVPD